MAEVDHGADVVLAGQTGHDGVGVFGRLAAYVDAEHLAHLPLTAQIGAAATKAARLRGYRPPDRPERDDLGDPVGRVVAAFRDCAKMIRANLKTMIELLVDGSVAGRAGTPPA